MFMTHGDVYGRLSSTFIETVKLHAELSLKPFPKQFKYHTSYHNIVFWKCWTRLVWLVTVPEMHAGINFLHWGNCTVRVH